jgi:hypothetical protein
VISRDNAAEEVEEQQSFESEENQGYSMSI